MALEFWRLQRVRELRVDGTRRGLMGRDRREEEGWKRELVANCAYAPLTVCRVVLSTSPLSRLVF